MSEDDYEKKLNLLQIKLSRAKADRLELLKENKKLKARLAESQLPSPPDQTGLNTRPPVLLSFPETINFQEIPEGEINPFYRIFITAPFPILISRISDGILVEINQAGTELTGYGRKEALGRCTVDLLRVKPEVQEKLLEELSLSGSIYNFEQKFFTKAGEERNGLASFEGVNFSGEYFIVSTFYDLTSEKRAGEALLKSEKFLQAILDNSPLPIQVKDLEGRYLLFNKKCEALAKIGIEKVLGRTPYDFFPRDRVEIALARDTWVLENRQPLVQEEISYQDGKEINEIVTRFPLFGPDGEIYAVAGIFLDITEMKKAEEELKNSREQFESILKAVEDGVVALDSNENFYFANSTAARLFGFSSVEEFITSSPGTLFNRIEFINEAGQLLPVDQFPQSIALKKKTPDQAVLGYRDKETGNLTWVSLKSNLVLDSRGEPRMVISAMTDITNLKLNEEKNLRLNQDLEEKVQLRTLELQAALGKLEKEIQQHQETFETLKQSEARLSKVFRLSPAAISITSLKTGLFLEANESFFQLTGYSPEDIKVQTPDTLGLWEKLPRSQVLSQVRTRGGLYQVESTLRKKTGEQCEVLGSVEIIEIEGEEAVLSILQDNSVQKKLELDLRETLSKEMELGELKSRFVAMASHEFRTPLSVIQSNTELLEYYPKKWNEAKKTELYGRIHHSVQRMADLLDDILFIGKAEAGKLEFKPALLDLVEVCRLQISDIRTNKNLKPIINFSVEGKPRNIMADKKLLIQILSNLLSNAVKYSTGASPVDLSVCFQAGEIEIQVMDRGIGIPAEELPEIFGAFHRAKNSGTVQGTGLGLAIVKRSVELSQGNIQVESTQGSGTTFRVFLPV